MSDDLNAIRELPKNKELIQQYKNIIESEIDDKMQDTFVYEEQTVEIPLTKEGGVCKVKCAINDLPLYFVFDTEASDVSHSFVEATFRVKTVDDLSGRKRKSCAKKKKRGCSCGTKGAGFAVLQKMPIFES